MKQNRYIQTTAIILATRRFGDLHRSITLLSPEQGLIDAVAYGARKGSGKLSGWIEPFVTGQFYLYYNPVSQRYKVEDVGSPQFREHLRLDLYAHYLATFWAELIIRTYSGGGSFVEVYRWLEDALDVQSGLEGANGRPELLIQSVWRYIACIGYAPDISVCEACGRDLSGQAAVFPGYDPGSFRCSSCSEQRVLSLSSGAVSYLLYTAKLPLEKAVSVRLENASLNALHDVTLFYVHQIVDGTLNTLKGGIL